MTLQFLSKITSLFKEWYMINHEKLNLYSKMEEILVPFFDGIYLGCTFLFFFSFYENEMVVETSHIYLFIFCFQRFGHLQIQNDKGF